MEKLMLIISSCQHNRRTENLPLFVTAVREREKYWKRVKKKKRKRAWKGEREVAMWDHLYSESRIKIPHHSILLFFFFLILLLNFIFNLFLCLLILRQILVFVSPSLPLSFSLHLCLFLLSVWLNDKAWDESAFFFSIHFFFFSSCCFWKQWLQFCWKSYNFLLLISLLYWFYKRWKMMPTRHACLVLSLCHHTLCQ